MKNMRRLTTNIFRTGGSFFILIPVLLLAFVKMMLLQNYYNDSVAVVVAIEVDYSDKGKNDKIDAPPSDPSPRPVQVTIEEHSNMQQDNAGYHHKYTDHDNNKYNYDKNDDDDDDDLYDDDAELYYEDDDDDDEEINHMFHKYGIYLGDDDDDDFREEL